MMRDDKFFDKVKDQVVFRTTDDSKYTTLADYLYCPGRCRSTIRRSTTPTTRPPRPPTSSCSRARAWRSSSSTP
ncbi:MAG: hypothetical protein R2864_09365 [Syntrophotaleaceae bacterium]